MSFIFKASDLLKGDERKKEMRYRNYSIQLRKCLDTISSINTYAHKQFTAYLVPSSLPGDPNFDTTECIKFLKEELRKLDFYVKLLKDGNNLLISWKPEDVQYVKAKNDKVREELRKIKENERKQREELMEKEREKKRKEFEEKQNQEIVIKVNPQSALSQLQYTTELMKTNPSYSHLKSIQKLKKKNGKK